jgi:hypothetical protein
MHRCEIVYVVDAKGWKWRALGDHQTRKPVRSEETFQLYYECVLAARAKGYDPEIKCR